MSFPPDCDHSITDISDHEFDFVTAGYQIPVLIEFWKPGCGHCQSLLRELEGLQLETKNTLKIFKMNVEENFLIPADLEIFSLPALAVFVQGEFQQFIGGIGKKNELMKTLTPWLS